MGPAGVCRQLCEGLGGRRPVPQAPHVNGAAGPWARTGWTLHFALLLPLLDPKGPSDTLHQLDRPPAGATDQPGVGKDWTSWQIMQLAGDLLSLASAHRVCTHPHQDQGRPGHRLTPQEPSVPRVPSERGDQPQGSVLRLLPGQNHLSRFTGDRRPQPTLLASLPPPPPPHSILSPSHRLRAHLGAAGGRGRAVQLANP